MSASTCNRLHTAWYMMRYDHSPCNRGGGIVPYQHALATYYTLLILYDEVLYMPVDKA